MFLSFTKLILCVGVLSFTFSLGYGQDTLNVSKEAVAQAMAERMARELSLDQKQTNQVNQLLQKRLQDIDESMQKGKIADSAIQSINKNCDKKLSAILSKEQYQAFLNLREALKSQKQAYYTTHPESSGSDLEAAYDYY